MAWYKTGTVSVSNGSTTVTGSGTAWVVNTAAGEAIYLPDGRFYEIASVNSDTQLTLAAPYGGTSVSSQPYTILPSQSFIRDLANQAAALLNNYSTIASTTGQGAFADGTVSAPGLRFVSDTDTGVRRTASGTFVFVSNGVDVLEVSPSGVKPLVYTEKTTPVDADTVPLTDSAASGVLKKLTWANVKTALRTWIEGLTFTTLGANTVTVAGSTALNAADVGSTPERIPAVSLLGAMAFQDPAGVVLRPQASVAPAMVGDMVFQLSNDTTLVIKVRGSDGVVRMTTLTLA